jgi:Rod binding domain-containing protein
MGFNPTTDVVLDVLNAADPARASLAAERLQGLASGAPASDFALDLDKAAAAAAASKAPELPGLANARQTFADAALASDPEAKAKVEFEAMTLNSFVGEMLPKDTTALFGQGTAGEIWRSMLSDQISRQIAKSGELGLSRRLFATHGIAMGERTHEATREGAAIETSANVLSAPAAADIANGAILTAARRRT